MLTYKDLKPFLLIGFLPSWVAHSNYVEPVQTMCKHHYAFQPLVGKKFSGIFPMKLVRLVSFKFLTKKCSIFKFSLSSPQSSVIIVTLIQ